MQRYKLTIYFANPDEPYKDITFCESSGKKAMTYAKKRLEQEPDALNASLYRVKETCLGVITK